MTRSRPGLPLAEDECLAGQIGRVLEELHEFDALTEAIIAGGENAAKTFEKIARARCAG